MAAPVPSEPHLFRRSSLWRRWQAVLVQVTGCFGAGKVFFRGPAPCGRTRSNFVAQVPHLSPHLRQNSVTPAPESGLTCAVVRPHLRREIAPAPFIVPIVPSFGPQDAVCPVFRVHRPIIWTSSHRTECTSEYTRC